MLHAVQVGFMVGFLCSFLGGVSQNVAVLGVGIAFVVVFIVGIVMFITSLVSLQKSQVQVRRQMGSLCSTRGPPVMMLTPVLSAVLFDMTQVMQMGMANLDPLQRTLAESHPTVRMEAFNIKPPLMFQLKITIVQNTQQVGAADHLQGTLRRAIDPVAPISACSKVTGSHPLTQTSLPAASVPVSIWPAAAGTGQLSSSPSLELMRLKTQSFQKNQAVLGTTY